MSDSISFVTGASGFIASHVVQQLLDMGHKVHATVRRPPPKKRRKYSILWTCKSDGPANWHYSRPTSLYLAHLKLQWKVVCSVVYHVALPFFIKNTICDGQKEVVGPALKGTHYVLDAVQKCKTVKTVVLTSSMAAIFGNNANVMETKQKTLSAEYFNTTCSVKYNAYPMQKLLLKRRPGSCMKRNHSPHTGSWWPSTLGSSWVRLCLQPPNLGAFLYLTSSSAASCF